MKGDYRIIQERHKGRDEYTIAYTIQKKRKFLWWKYWAYVKEFDYVTGHMAVMGRETLNDAESYVEKLILFDIEKSLGKRKQVVKTIQTNKT